MFNASIHVRAVLLTALIEEETRDVIRLDITMK